MYDVVMRHPIAPLVPTMQTKHFYFRIPSKSVRDYVEAFSFNDAKARVWRTYSEYMDEIIWEDTTNPPPVEEKCARLFF